MAKPDWGNRPLSPDYLIESGLLWEANRTIFHLLGLSLVVQNDTTGRSLLTLKDFRDEPEKVVFDRATMIRGRERLREFMAAFGHAQMDRRSRRLGWCCQPDVDPNLKQEKGK